MKIPNAISYSMPGLESLPSQRTDWQLCPSRAVLLIHDMQNYFLDGFSKESDVFLTLIENIKKLRSACESASIPVFYSAQPTQQSQEKRGLLNDWWGAGITAHPDRAAIIEALVPKPDDFVFDKYRYSAFSQTDFGAHMRRLKKDQIIICGVYAHIGCMITCADAFMNDLKAFVVGDSLGDFSLGHHMSALSWIAECAGVVLPTKKVLEGLMV